MIIFIFSPFGKNILFQVSLKSQANKQSDTKISPDLSILPVETMTIQPVTFIDVVRNYTGTIMPNRSSDLSLEISGKLTAIAVKEGDNVIKGMPLAFLDTATLKITQKELLAQRKQIVAKLKEMENGARVETIATAKANVRQLQTELELAQQKSDRREILYNEGAISQEQRDEAVNEVATIQARLDQTQSQLDELLAGTRFEQIKIQKALIEQQDFKIANLELEIEKTVLKAPFSGTISARLVDEGTIVKAGQTLLKLVEDSQLEAHIGVPVNNASQIKIGDIFPLQIEEKTYQATVSSILPELDPSTRTVTIILKLKQEETSKIFSGQVAKLQLTENININGYWLPITALVQGEKGLWSCYILGEKQEINSENQSVFQVEQKTVEILQTESERVLVRGTLKPNDQVIVDGIHRLVAGQLVTVSKPLTISQ